MFDSSIIPDSIHVINKLFNPKSNCEYHGICPHCSEYIGAFSKLDTNSMKICKNCKQDIDVFNPSSPSFYATIDPSDQIKETINRHQDYYDDIVNKVNNSDKIFGDIYDGELYRKFVDSLPDSEKKSYATVTLNTDGLQAFKDSTYSIWPIYLMVNELPIEIRLKNLIVGGVWFGKSKPEMNQFLDSYVEKANNLFVKGVLCNIRGENRLIKVYHVNGVVDTPCRSEINGRVAFNSYWSCDWCFHPGEWCEGAMRFPIFYPIPVLRDKTSNLEHVMEAESIKSTESDVYGVRYTSSLHYLTGYDIIRGSLPDYLHCYLIGVGKRVINRILNSLSKENYLYIDNLMTKMKAPRQISRLPRSLSSIGKWKAREYENFILYYSVPLFSLILTKKKLDHWCLFVKSLHILLGDNVQPEKVTDADKMLHKFVYDTEEIYGKCEMTSNLHQMLHISRKVSDWGPLFAHSTYPFESFNYKISKSVKCARGVISQILRNMNFNYTLQKIEKYVYPENTNIINHYCKNYAPKRVKNYLKVNNISYFGSWKPVINNEILQQYNLSEHTHIYKKIVKNNCLYKSCYPEYKRSCNHFAKLTDGSYIKIINFLVDLETDTQITHCYLLTTRDVSYCKDLKKVVNINSKSIYILTQLIERVCVSIDINETQYISSVPNLQHY